MCRVLGCVAHDPVSLRHELLDADPPMIRDAGSGWGMAVYRTADGAAPECTRLPNGASDQNALRELAATRGRIFNVHVRRPSVGEVGPRNTHPFCLGNYSFSHNGTVHEPSRLDQRGAAGRAGETDSERLFSMLMRDFDPGCTTDCLRRLVEAVVERSPFSALNFLFSDGERLYAYRLGVFELHWRASRGKLTVASDGIDPSWHTVAQDVLVVLDPDDPEEPHAERLLGDAGVARARIEGLDRFRARQGVSTHETSVRVAAASGE